jgi:hypothetical protein
MDGGPSSSCQPLTTPGVPKGASGIGQGEVMKHPTRTYVLTGGLALSGSAKLTGRGVSVYLAGSSYPSPCRAGSAAAGISVSGNGSLTLTAPATATAQGVAVCADPAGTTSILAQGSASTVLTGSVHTPGASLQASGPPRSALRRASWPLVRPRSTGPGPYP